MTQNLCFSLSSGIVKRSGNNNNNYSFFSAQQRFFVYGQLCFSQLSLAYGQTQAQAFTCTRALIQTHTHTRLFRLHLSVETLGPTCHGVCLFPQELRASCLYLWVDVCVWQVRVPQWWRRRWYKNTGVIEEIISHNSTAWHCTAQQSIQTNRSIVISVLLSDIVTKIRIFSLTDLLPQSTLTWIYFCTWRSTRLGTICIS